MTDFAPEPAFAQSESIAELATALSAAQGELETVAKGEEVNTGSFKFSFANLATILESVRPVLAKHGLAVVQSPARVQGGVDVTTTLAHKSGEWMRGRLSMPTGKGDAQGVGSAISYARRYAISAMLGVATDDDDGKAASEAPGRSQRPEGPPLPKTNQPALVKGFRDALNIAPAVLESYLGHSLEEITDEEAATLVEYGKAIRAGNEEAREELCGPPPAKQLEMEMADDA